MPQVDTGFDLAMTDRLLTTTRSVRRRLDLSRDVERAVLDECMDIALQAATGGNLQRWRWVVVRDAAKRAAIGHYYARAFREMLAKVAPATETPAVADSGASPRHEKFNGDIVAQNRLMESVDVLIEHLQDVPAEFAAKRWAELAERRFVHHFLELRHHLSGADPAEISALQRRAAIVGIGARNLREVVAVFEAQPKLLQTGERFLVVQELAW